MLVPNVGSKEPCRVVVRNTTRPLSAGSDKYGATPRRMVVAVGVDYA